MAVSIHLIFSQSTLEIESVRGDLISFKFNLHLRVTVLYRESRQTPKPYPKLVLGLEYRLGLGLGCTV